MFDVTIENEFDFASAEYAAFYAASGASAFQHPIWLKHIYGTLLPRRQAKPLIVVVRDEGRLALLLPLVRRRLGPLRLVEFADFGVCDYAAPVATPADFGRIVADASARQAVRTAIEPYDLVRFNKLPDGGLALHRLFDAHEPVPLGASAYAVGLGSDFSEWRTRSLSRSYRKELDKKARQLERRGEVRFACTATREETERVFERMRYYRRLRFASREGRELLQLEPFFDFYQQVAADGLGGVARTYFISVDGEPVACVFGLGVAGRFLVLLSGFDQARFKNQSLGALLFERVAQDCIARGDLVLDFTIGDEPYKVTFGGQPTPMWVVMRAATPLGWLARATLLRLPRLRALMRRRTGHMRRPPAAPPPPEGAPIVIGDGRPV